MRAVIQRVNTASVNVDNVTIGHIDSGLLVFLGIEDNDNEQDIKYLSEKICGLRIFEDKEEKMNLSLIDVDGDLLVVSQFTLYGDCRKGKRPNFMAAARPEFAEKLYLMFIEECKKYVKKVEQGKFQADMKVSLINNGPVTIMLDSKKNF